MSRPLRSEFAGALYHLPSRGNERKPIFRNESDFSTFIELIINQAAQIAMTQVYLSVGYSMKEMASYFGVNYSTVSRAVE